MQMGLVFSGPMPEPPHRMRRMHNVLPNSPAYGYQLGRAICRAGVRIVLGASAQELLVDGGIIDYVARNGVVLAAGDYSAGNRYR